MNRIIPILFRKSLLTNVGPSRSVHNHVSAMIYSLRSRRIKQEKKNPVPKPLAHRNTFLDWNYNAELFAFCKRLNEDVEDSLLRQALTDKAYVVKEQQRQEEVGLNVEGLVMKDNEYMSSEGRTLLQHIQNVLISEFPLFPEEGIKAVQEYLVSDKVLSNIAAQIGMKDLIQCVDIPPSDETFARSFCALLSAIEKSSGRERVNTFIEDFVITHLCDKDVNEIWDVPKPLGMLTDIMSSKGETFEARLLREAGKNTLLSVFIVGLYTPEKKLIGTGFGESVEIAQEMAARDGLSRIFGTKCPRPTFKFLLERSKNAAAAATRPANPVVQVEQLKARH